MTELELKYGCNPNQKPARIFMQEGELPLQVLNGRPGYINFMDALNSWQLVQELKQATGLPAAASFKHVSPAGAAVGSELTDLERKIYFAEGMDLSPIPPPMSGPGAPTGCPPTATGAPSPTPAMSRPPAIWPWRSPTASSPQATPTRPWRFSGPSARAATMSSRSTPPMSRQRSNAARFSASGSSRATTA